MNSKIALLLALSFNLSGCGLYVVKKSRPAGKHHGIPFYVKTGGCKREILRLEPYYILTLTTKAGDKVIRSESAVVSKLQFNLPAVRSFRDAMAGQSIPAGVSIDDLWNPVKLLQYEPHRPEMEIEVGNWFVISDTMTPYTYVDYEHPYTLNARRPIIGSASATTKLAEDGTLSEGTAQIEDKTLETVLGLVPAADLIKSAAGIHAMAALGPGNLSYELKIEQKGVKFTRLYRYPANHTACLRVADAGVDPTDAKYDLVVEDVGEEKKPSDENTVKVNGSIQLPKSKDVKP
jgi:hypothetical protein